MAKSASRSSTLGWVAVLVTGIGCSSGSNGPDAAPEPSARSAPSMDAPYLVLVSFDGFRHDYLERFPTPNFDRLGARGVRAEGLIPVFPSKTFPGHYTIVTGLYPDRHGIVANEFIDPERNERYSLSDRSEVEDGTWYGGEPIWATAERQGMIAASWFWVGSESALPGQLSYNHRYDGGVPNDERADGVLAWLSLEPEARPHVITLYFSLVDDAGHRVGPWGEAVGEAVREADRLLGRLLDGLRDLDHGDEVYVVVVSDHGMTEASALDAIDVGALQGVSMINAGAYANFIIDEDAGVLTAEAVRDSLADWLPESAVYLREDVPPELHHRDPRVGDVIVSVAEGRLVQAVNGSESSARGHHGYDPRVESMHGIFLAAGPGITAGQLIPRFEMVHIYPWLVDQLGLVPAEDLDGDLSVLANAIKREP